MNALAASLKSAHDEAPRRDAWDAVAALVSDREAVLVAYVHELERMARIEGYDIDAVRIENGIVFDNEEAYYT